LYSVQLEKWFCHFNKEQFLILFYEEALFKNKQATIQSIYNHIEVDNSFLPSNINKSSNKRESNLEMRIRPFSKIAAKATGFIVPNKIKNHPSFGIPISQSSKEKLQAYFHSPNKDLEKLLSREIPW